MPDALIDNVEIASTLSSNAVVSKELVANIAKLIKLNLNNTEVESIVNDLNNPSNKTIPTTYALEKFINEIFTIMEQYQNKVDVLTKHTVISDPIITPYFLDSKEWETDTFIFDDSKAIFIKKDISVDGELILPAKFFLYKGRYFIEVTVSELTNGSLIAYNSNGEEIIQIIAPGIYGFEFTLENPGYSYLLFRTVGMQLNDSIVINSIFAYKVEDNIDKYLLYKGESLLSGGEGGFITPAQLQIELTRIQTSLETYVNNILGSDLSSLLIHVSNVDNPHNVTYDQTGAAAEDHTHTLTELGAAAAVHTHSASDITGLVTALTDLSTLLNNFNTHINTNNPHNITSETIHLENVMNYPVATVTEGIQGTEERYVTSDILKAVIEDRIGNLEPGQVLVSKLNTVYDFTLDMDDYEKTLKTVPGSTYTICINAQSTGLEKLHIRLNNDFDFVYNLNVIDLEGPSFNEYNLDSFIFIPDSSITQCGGKILITLNTNLSLIHGYGKLNTKNEFNQVTSNFNYNYTGYYNYDFSVNVDHLNIYLENDNLDARESVEITIYESFLEANFDASIEIDVAAVGTIDDKIGNTPSSGWVVLDGSGISITNNIEIYNLASTKNLILDISEYMTHINNFGHCYYFATDIDYPDQLKLPKFPQDKFTPLSSPMLKIKPGNNVVSNFFKAKISVVKHPTLNEYVLINKTDNVTNWSVVDGDRIIIECPEITMESSIIGTPIFNSDNNISSIVVGEDFSQRTVGKCEFLIQVANGANIAIY